MSRDRSLVLALAAVGAAALVAPSVLSAGKRVVFNTTASAPIGFYWLEHRAPAIGDLAVVRPPAALAAWMARRRYLPLNVPLLKGVVATAGTQVCVVDERVFVAGRIVAVARTRDRWGRPLTPWRGCRRLAADEVFLLNLAAPASLDSRYFGPLRRQDIVGPARPMWTWER